jgi:predicted transcriptional regulator
VSIRPQYVEKILAGEKTVELRRRFPETAVLGATALVYSSSPVQAIVCRARIKDVSKLSINQIWKNHRKEACISKSDFDNYFEGIDFGFVVFLDNIKRLKKRVAVSDLEDYGIVPPQSYRYLGDNFDFLLSNGQVQSPNRHSHRNRA